MIVQDGQHLRWKPDRSAPSASDPPKAVPVNDQKTAYALLFFTTLFWAGNAIAGKLAVGHISPMVLTSLRWATAVAILLVIGGRQAWQDRAALVRAAPILIAYGLIGFAFFNISLYTALTHTFAINVAIEQAAIPLLIFIGNFLLFRTRLGLWQFVGFAMTLAGVAIVASNGSLQRLAALQFNQGDAWMVLAGLFYASYSIALRWKPQLHWKSIMMVMATAALVGSLPFSWWEVTYNDGILPDTRGWIIVVYTALFPSLAAQVFYIRGIELIGANRAGIFINLVPVLATGMAIVILGEDFGAHHALAIILVVGGIMLAERLKPAG